LRKARPLFNFAKRKKIDYWRLPNPAEMEINQAREIRNQIKAKVLTLIEELR